jgi:ABC-type amino acid transport substrate-binding protein
VAIEPYMPYTAEQNGQLIGLDSDIFNYIATRLHQKVNVTVTNFAGMLSGVQTRRVDIAIGGIAWSASRAAVGIFTDPPYYSPVALAEQKGENITSIDGLQGKSVGTVTGYIFVNAIRQIPGVTLHAYQDAPTAFTDLQDGRVNALVIDTLLVIYHAKQDAGAGLTSDYLTRPPASSVMAAGHWLDRRRRRGNYRAVRRLLPVPGGRGGGPVRARRRRARLQLGQRGLDQPQRVGPRGRAGCGRPGPAFPGPAGRAAVPEADP